MKHKGNRSAREQEQTRRTQPPVLKNKLEEEDTRIVKTAGAACRQPRTAAPETWAPSGKPDNRMEEPTDGGQPRLLAWITRAISSTTPSMSRSEVSTKV